MDNFAWPEPETLPEDMQNVWKFNGVRWIHDYQDACVEKVERFMRGELSGIRDGASSGLSLNRSGGVGGGIGPSTIKSDPSAPNTPLTVGRSPPTYQRTQSNDSERDLTGSKDWLAGNTSRYGTVADLLLSRSNRLLRFVSVRLLSFVLQRPSMTSRLGG